MISYAEYKGEDETLLLAVVPTRSYFIVKEGLKEIDNNIFFLVCDSYEVSDNGDLSWNWIKRKSLILKN